jgi:type I restriction enzyme S subunit
MSGKYQAYPEYKESSYGWLGSVPLDWTVSKTGRFFKIAMGQTILKEQLDENASWPVYSATEKDVFFGYIDQPQVRLAPGDLVIPARGNSIGAVKLVSCNSTTTQTTIYCKQLTRKVSPRYAYYYMLGLRDNLFWFTQTAIPQITVEEVSTNPIVVPSLGEQRTIAAFLDHETARIDRLIEKQQRLIELLKEKRQAVISHAVTKGLDPNVPMKDSGVEWLGQVPEHWVIRRLKHTAQLQSGIPKGKDLSGKQTISVSMLRVANVQDGYVKLDDVHQIEIEPHELMRYSLQSGDVLMNEGGDNDKLGRGAVWHGQLEPCIHQNHVFAIRVSDIEPEWLSLVTGSKYAKYHFYCVAKQSTNLASISSSNIKETPLVIPPEIERQQIMEYLANMTSKLDQVSEFASKQIALLQERRTALISAAVTGKIDVRNWQPNTNTQAAEPDLPMAAEQATEYRI